MLRVTWPYDKLFYYLLNKQKNLVGDQGRDSVTLMLHWPASNIRIFIKDFFYFHLNYPLC